MKDHISNTKLEKGMQSLLHPNAAQGSFFPLQSYSGGEKRGEMHVFALQATFF